MKEEKEVALKDGRPNEGRHWGSGVVERIVSGGQTGADRGGLDAAIRLGIPHGGWCPKGRRSEEGEIPAGYLLVETTTRGYIDRTRRNVVDSDATVVFTKGRPTVGSRQTIEMACEAGRPVLHVDVSRWPRVRAADIDRFCEWLGEHGVRTLNVAGSRESGAPGLHDAVERFLLEALTPAADEVLPLAAEPPATWGETSGGDGGSDGGSR